MLVPTIFKQHTFHSDVLLTEHTSHLVLLRLAAETKQLILFCMLNILHSWVNNQAPLALLELILLAVKQPVLFEFHDFNELTTKLTICQHFAFVFYMILNY